MSLFNELFYETGSFSDCLMPHRFLEPEGFEALVSHTGTLACMVYLVLKFFLPAYLNVNVGPPGLPPFCMAPVPPLLISALLTGMDECFFFNSLVVGLPYTSIFWQFWLFFVFKFVVLFWLCKEAKCIYLCLHLGQKS